MGIYLNKIRRKVGFNYERNIALRLILSLAGFYIGLQALYIIIMVLADDQKFVLKGYFIPNIGLQSFEVLLQKPWIILSHFLYTQGFFEFATNMLWLYVFSSVIQTLVGYKEILPLFIISCLVAAFGVMSVNELVALPNYILMGSYAGIMAMAAACMVLAPNYKLFLAERISVPMWGLFAIFIVLNAIMVVPHDVPLMLLMGFGLLSGTVYMLLLKNGFQIGKRLANFSTSMAAKIGKNNKINEEEFSVSKMLKNDRNIVIDEILDKIHQKGLLSLTAKEKALLEEYSDSI